MKEFKPEACYEKTNMQETKIKVGTAVVGTAIEFDSRKRQLIVELGGSCRGIIPEDEVSVYDLTYAKGKSVPQQVTSIISRQIRAIVTDVINDSTFILSRRQSMIEAWETLKDGKNTVGVVINNISYGIFLDVGNGIVTYISTAECSSTWISDTRTWFKDGEELLIRILSKGSNPTNRIISSRRLIDITKVKIGDICCVRIGTKIVGGYFCEVTPYWRGIIDSSEQFYEGEVVKGIVKKITAKGVKLDLIN